MFTVKSNQILYVDFVSHGNRWRGGGRGLISTAMGLFFDLPVLHPLRVPIVQVSRCKVKSGHNKVKSGHNGASNPL